MARRRAGVARNVRTHQRELAQRREALERRWFRATEMASQFVNLVVQDVRLHEPYHRWLPYRQGFSPELVRRVIKDGELADGPLLDPFSGGGTTLIEAARQGYPALAAEIQPALVFLANARFLESDTRLVFPAECTTFDQAWAWAPDDLHRAAVLCAAARTVSGDGKPLKNLPPERQLLDVCVELINNDREKPLAATGECVCADARELPFDDESVGGILASPPYLSRYDYTRVNLPIERLFSGADSRDDQKDRQIRAHHRARRQNWSDDVHPAIAETCERLIEEDRKKDAGVVRSYADDMRRVIAECTRVLMPGAPLVMVVASVVFGSVYVPADSLLIDYAADLGLEVEEILCVRTFSDHGKSLGSIKSVLPREIIFTVRKPA